MSRDSVYFLLIDERTKDRFRFTLAELKMFVQSASKSQLSAIKVQVEGRAEWQRLEKFVVDRPPRPEVEVFPEEETTVIELRQNLEKTPQYDKPRPSQERRHSPRAQIRRRVIIVAGEFVFRTFTVDASIDGLRLEHSVPKKLQGQVVDCYLSSQDLLTGVCFRAVLVEGGSDAVRLRFVEQDAKNTAILGRWLSNLQRQSA
ncbi:MAG: PilZ domain-containing protein [Bdellovibrionales bacterium]